MSAVHIGNAGVEGELNAGHLGEGADGLGGGAGSGLQGLQKLGAGHVDGGHGVAEGEDGQQALLGNVALGQSLADAAAVGQRGVHVLLAQSLAGLPQDGVGGKVAQVGLSGADALALGEGHLGLGDGIGGRAAGAGAVQIHLGGGDLLAVDFINGGVAVVHQLGHIGVGLGVGGGGNQLVGQGAGLLIVDYHAHVGQSGAGGDDLGAVDHVGIAYLGNDIGSGGVAVAVYEQVNAIHVLAHVDGAVADALVIDAQVAQADNQIGAGLVQLIDLSLGDGVQLVGLGEGDAGHLGGVGLGQGLGGGQAEHAHLHAAEVKDLVGIEDSLAVGLSGHVGAQDGEVGILGQGLEVVDAEVQLMVAHSHGIITGGVHELDGALALVGAHQGLAHDGVAGRDQQHIGAGGLEVLLQLGHTGHAEGSALLVQISAVGVVGMENNNLTIDIGNDIGGCGFFLCGKGGPEQGAHHSQHEEQGQEFACGFSHRKHSTFPHCLSL